MNTDNKNIIIIDLDGTICQENIHGVDYFELEPKHDVVKKLRIYKDKGYLIHLFTARNMRKFKGDVDLIKQHTLPVIINWLTKWDIPYDLIQVGKPWCGEMGFYVDDKSIRPDEFVNMDEKEIMEIISKWS